MLESVYQARLIKKLRKLFNGCVILKNDSDYMQGVPDLTILYGTKWAMLEVKTSEKEPYQPNQEWYLAQFDRMSFASVIYPEIEKDVLNALQHAFRSGGQARVS